MSVGSDSVPEVNKAIGRRRVDVGDRVRLLQQGVPYVGVVMFRGPTQFAEGVWLGVFLDTCDGKNDGSVSGVRYFECTPGHGLFCKPKMVQAENDVSLIEGTTDNHLSAFDAEVEDLEASRLLFGELKAELDKRSAHYESEVELLHVAMATANKQTRDTEAQVIATRDLCQQQERAEVEALTTLRIELAFFKEESVSLKVELRSLAESRRVEAVELKLAQTEALKATRAFHVETEALRESNLEIDALKGRDSTSKFDSFEAGVEQGRDASKAHWEALFASELLETSRAAYSEIGALHEARMEAETLRDAESEVKALAKLSREQASEIQEVRIELNTSSETSTTAELRRYQEISESEIRGESAALRVARAEMKDAQVEIEAFKEAAQKHATMNMDLVNPDEAESSRGVGWASMISSDSTDHRANIVPGSLSSIMERSNARKKALAEASAKVTQALSEGQMAKQRANQNWKLLQAVTATSWMRAPHHKVV